MNVTSTQARFTASWTVEIILEMGSVPDRPMPYRRAGAVYRPQRVTLKFATTVRRDDPATLKLENGQLFLADARDGIRVDGTHICGPGLKADGTPGQHVVSERFYGQDGTPDWLRELVTEAREKLA